MAKTIVEQYEKRKKYLLEQDKILLLMLEDKVFHIHRNKK